MLEKRHLSVIAGCCLLMVAVSIPANCMGIFLKPVSNDLAIAYPKLSFYITIQYISMIVFLPIAGKVMSGVHMRKAMAIAILCTSCALLAMSFAKDIAVFYIAGVAIGAGMAFLLVLPVPLIINAWFSSRNGLLIGTAYMFLSIGAAILSPLGGYIIQNYSWQSAYQVFALIILAALPVIALLLKHNPDSGGNTRSTTDNTGAELTQAAKTPGFYMAFIFAGILGMLPTLVIHLPTYASSIGLSPVYGAGVLSAALFGGATGKLISGLVNDKLGTAPAAATSMCAGAAGLLLMLFVHEYHMVLAAGFLFGIGYSSTVVLPPLLVRKLFGSKNYSKIYSVIMTANSLGSATGAWLYGYLYNSSGKFTGTFVLTSVLMLIALLLCIAAIPRRVNT